MLLLALPNATQKSTLSHSFSKSFRRVLLLTTPTYDSFALAIFSELSITEVFSVGSDITIGLEVDRDSGIGLSIVFSPSLNTEIIPFFNSLS